MIYLDNSSSTLIKPKSVQKAVLNALQFYTANPGRSGHRLALKTAFEVESVRELLARHVGTTPENVVFTAGCTDALNLAIFGTARAGNVVCTVNEHNSVMRPLEHLRATRDDFSYTIAQSTGKLGVTWQDIERALTDNTYMVVVNHISNVNGDVADIDEIAQNLQLRGIMLLVDGAQSGGHVLYNMQKQGINMLALAAHKGFYGPQGVGALCICGDVPLQPVRFGGTGTNSLELVQPSSRPECFESGTLNTPGILGFGEGIRFVEENFSAIAEKLEDLTTYLHYELSKLPLEIYTKTENTSGVFAFNVPTMNSTDVANILNDRFGICVRSGYQCTALKHKSLGTQSSGAVRVSLSFFNTYQEIEKFVYAIKSILRSAKI